MNKNKKLDETLNMALEYIIGYNDDFTFDDVALALYELHMDRNILYKKYANKNIDKIHTWEDIPLMPSYEFNEQMVELDMNTSMPYPGVLFKHARFRHYMRNTDHYRASILRGLKDTLFDGLYPGPLYKVIDLNHQSNNDNITYYTELLGDLMSYDRRTINAYLTSPEDFISLLKKFVDEPMIIVGHLDNFERIYDGLETIKLHPESKIIKINNTNKNDSQYGLAKKFHIKNENVITMYQHPLLSSQLYHHGVGNNKFSIPSTVKFRSDNAKKTKRTGVVDLANVWSCPFIRINDATVVDLFEVQFCP